MRARRDRSGASVHRLVAGAGSRPHGAAVSGGYVFAGYGITVGSLGLYAARVLRRGRLLARSLPGDVPLAEPGPAAAPGAATDPAQP